VRFVFFDMEELGLVGSKHFVDAADTTRIAAAVNVDVAGYGDTIAYGPTASGRAGFLAPLLQQRCAAVQVSCLPFEQYPASDDLSFQAAGIPALSLAVVPAVEAHQIWLLSNGGANSGLAPGFLPRVLTIIHTPGDQMDKLEPDAMVLACRVLRDLVLQIDARR
jgi:Zn-dependent M28 family amino/carboxypeptidase